MKVKSFFGQMMLLSFVFALLFASSYSENGVEPKVCSEGYASVGNIFCDENAKCLEVDGAFTCSCNNDFVGDGWSISLGCTQEGSSFASQVEGREKRGFWPVSSVGDFLQQENLTPCSGFMAIMGRLVCDRNAYCMEGYRSGLWLRCHCRRGSGNGIRMMFPQGTGCRL